MSNVPDDYYSYYCRKCGETPCECGSYCSCGEYLDDNGKCPECEPTCEECGLDADPLEERDGKILCGPCAEEFDKENYDDEDE